jgi:hypothetical protein
MWFLWLIVGIAVVVIYLVYLGETACPQCGTPLTSSATPWVKAKSCRCGWRER